MPSHPTPIPPAVSCVKPIITNAVNKEYSILQKAILPQADVMTFHGSAVVYYSMA